MQLVRFDPFGIMRDVDRMLEGWSGSPGWVPRINVTEHEGTVEIRAELPGIDAEELDVTLEDNTLVIAGERSFDTTTEKAGYHRREIYEGRFSRTILLPDGLNNEEIAADYQNGILTITVPKRPEVLPRKVKVSVTH